MVCVCFRTFVSLVSSWSLGVVGYKRIVILFGRFGYVSSIVDFVENRGIGMDRKGGWTYSCSVV